MIEKIMVWLREPVTAKGRSRAWRIWFWDEPTIEVDGMPARQATVLVLDGPTS